MTAMATTLAPAKSSTSVLLPVPEAARLLRVSPRYLRTLVSRGDLPVVRLGRRVLIARSDLDVLVAANRTSAVAAPRRGSHNQAPKKTKEQSR